MSVIEIKNEKLTVGIDTFGSELMYINSKDTEFLWNGDANVWSYRAPVLFPICGGLKEDTYIYNGEKYNLEKHGFAKKAEFEGKLLSDSKAEFVLKPDENIRKSYPFDFVFKIVFEVIGNTLKVTNIVENLTDGNMYFSIGAHEGYSCPEGIEEYDVIFDENQTLDRFTLEGGLLSYNSVRVLEDNNVLPLKYEYFTKDALVFKDVKFKNVTLKHRSSSKKIVLKFDNAEYFLIWTKPNANYVCLEPWCGLPDLVGSVYEIEKKKGIVELTSGEIFTDVHTIEFFD